MQPDDAYWRRPAGDPAAPGEAGTGPYGEARPAGYTGPPPSTPPPTGWRPERVVQPPPPRQLPTQDHDRIDSAEMKARGVTVGVAIVIAAVLTVLVCVLCARALF